MANIHRAAFGIIIFAASPIMLIHGYSEDSSVWSPWKEWLAADNFTNVYPITFSKDDQCGTVADHATELNGITNKILKDTGSKKVDIVTHSKGGLDARWYISHFDSDRVKNLVMIGTPNEGTPAAYIDVTTCAFKGSAGRVDLQPDSKATQSKDQEGTNYYTLAGDYAVPCYIVMQRHTCYISPNDGWVTVESALSDYKSLGVFPYNHTGLLTHKDVYQKVLQAIVR